MARYTAAPWVAPSHPRVVKMTSMPKTSAVKPAAAGHRLWTAWRYLAKIVNFLGFHANAESEHVAGPVPRFN